MFINSDKIGNKGLTLIEILVTITIFSIVITATSSLFASAIQYQSRALGSAYLLDAASFITEYISRAVRMAQKDLDGTCITAKDNFATSSQGRVLKFKNYEGDCQEFYFNEPEQALWVKKPGINQPLTPSNIIVEALKFNISGESQEDRLQPRVTFVLKLKTKGSEPQQLGFLQTTISQRQLDVRY